MTQPTPHQALYGKLMWPGWNPLAERQGTTDEEAERLIAEHRAAVLREAADAVEGTPTGDCSDADSYDEAWDWGVQAATNELRRMAEEART